MEHTNRSRGRVVGVILGVALAAAAVSVVVWMLADKPDSSQPQTAELPPYFPEPVPSNRGAQVRDGFHGDVHPVLTGQTSLEVTAHWTPVGHGRDQLHKTVPQSVYRLFTDLTPAVPRQIYTEQDFSALLPERIEAAGQVWEVDPEKLAGFLCQFHPQPSLHLVSLGRRAGPDGAFAALRAVSPTHLDIVFRLHAEFDLAQNVWLTPACFLGRMIVNREAGQVEYFRMWVPTENPLNMHLTVVESIRKGGTQPEIFRKLERGDVMFAKRDIVRVEQMELTSANSELFDTLTWPDAIDLGQAEHKLTAAFYKFLEIDWVPWKQAVAVASERQKPILAIVLWGALDDQSC